MGQESVQPLHSRNLIKIALISSDSIRVNKVVWMEQESVQFLHLHNLI